MTPPTASTDKDREEKVEVLHLSSSVSPAGDDENHQELPVTMVSSSHPYPTETTVNHKTMDNDDILSANNE
jgi:hypothetical protein